MLSRVRRLTGPALAAATPTAASLPPLGKVDREPLKISEFAVSQRAHMGGAKDDPWRLVCFKRLLPTRRAQAPTVAGLKAREAKLRHRRRQIITARFRKREKLRCHDSADRVAAYILLTGIAAAIAIEACHGFERTDFQRFAQYVAGWNRSATSVATVVSEHDLVLIAARADAEVYDTEREP
jgi:hypothetical protein